MPGGALASADDMSSSIVERSRLPSAPACKHWVDGLNKLVSTSARCGLEAQGQKRSHVSRRAGMPVAPVRPCPPSTWAGEVKPPAAAAAMSPQPPKPAPAAAQQPAALPQIPTPALLLLHLTPCNPPAPAAFLPAPAAFLPAPAAFLAWKKYSAARSSAGISVKMSRRSRSVTQSISSRTRPKGPLRSSPCGAAAAAGSGCPAAASLAAGLGAASACAAPLLPDTKGRRQAGPAAQAPAPGAATAAAAAAAAAGGFDGAVRLGWCCAQQHSSTRLPQTAGWQAAAGGTAAAAGGLGRPCLPWRHVNPKHSHLRGCSLPLAGPPGAGNAPAGCPLCASVAGASAAAVETRDNRCTECSGDQGSGRAGRAFGGRRGGRAGQCRYCSCLLPIERCRDGGRGRPCHPRTAACCEHAADSQGPPNGGCKPAPASYLGRHRVVRLQVSARGAPGAWPCCRAGSGGSLDAPPPCSCVQHGPDSGQQWRGGGMARWQPLASPGGRRLCPPAPGSPAPQPGRHAPPRAAPPTPPPPSRRRRHG